MSTEFHIKTQLKEFRPTSRAINLLDPIISDSANRIFQLKYPDGNKYSLYAYKKHIGMESKIESSVCFAVNTRNILMAWNKPLPGAKYPWPVYPSDLSQTLDIHRCLHLIGDLIDNLSLDKTESLHIYGNAVYLFVVPTRKLVPELKLLAAIRAVLAKHFPATTPPMDWSVIPDSLQDIVPLLEEWAMSDDLARQEKLEATPKEQLKKLVDQVAPKMKEINKYLDGFGQQTIPEQATAIGALAELVSEIQLRRG